MSDLFVAAVLINRVLEHLEVSELRLPRDYKKANKPEIFSLIFCPFLA